MINSGIYQIQNIVNGKCYIGSSCKISRRFFDHKSLLLKGLHYNIKLQRAWNKYGSDNFIFSVLEGISNDCDLIPKEQFWIDSKNPQYNICLIAGRTTGVEKSKEQREKISKRLIGNKYRTGKKTIHTMETRAKISAKLIGTRHSPESYRRASEKMKGRVSINRGRKASLETIQKLSDSHKGQVAWNRGRKLSPEHIRKLSESRKNCIAWNKGKTNCHILGKKYGCSKFTDEDVIAIRHKHSSGLSKASLSREYKVYKTTIGDIISRTTWRHI